MDSSMLNPEIPFLTYGQEDDGISADKHALIIPPYMGRAKRVHPMPYSDSSVSLSPRPMDPKKDLAVYGMVLWHGRKEWKNGEKGRMTNFNWLSTKVVVEMSWMILICPSSLCGWAAS